MNNPYAVPEADGDVAAFSSEERADHAKIAANQRAVCYFVLVYLLTIPVSIIAIPILSLVWMLIVLAMAIYALIHLIRLTSRLYGVGLTILFVILFFIPLVGLVMLLAVNARATAVLKKAGYRVGLIGASPSQFR